jgi:hypothetical protein
MLRFPAATLLLRQQTQSTLSVLAIHQPRRRFGRDVMDIMNRLRSSSGGGAKNDNSVLYKNTHRDIDLDREKRLKEREYMRARAAKNDTAADTTTDTTTTTSASATAQHAKEPTIPHFSPMYEKVEEARLAREWQEQMGQSSWEEGRSDTAEGLRVLSDMRWKQAMGDGAVAKKPKSSTESGNEQDGNSTTVDNHSNSNAGDRILHRIMARAGAIPPYLEKQQEMAHLEKQLQ